MSVYNRTIILIIPYHALTGFTLTDTAEVISKASNGLVELSTSNCEVSTFETHTGSLLIPASFSVGHSSTHTYNVTTTITTTIITTTTKSSNVLK